MQDIHAIGGGGGGGGGGRLFGGGDRRLRPHNHPNQQALKCPRCDSVNTKFCYYNNYNLSQPRHFCKSCRRYWTKGGVLRSVPVGGGCRKTKRSKQKNSAGAVSPGDAPREPSSKARSSSSESSSLTAAATAATPTSATTALAEEGSAPSKMTSSTVYAFPDVRFFNGNPNFDHQPMVNQSTSENQIFTPEIGGFASLIASSTDMIGFEMADIPTTSYGRVENGNQASVSDNSGAGATVEKYKMQEMTGGMSTGGLTAVAMDWGSGGDGGGGGGGEGDEGMFDLTAAVDPAYWSQPQWSDQSLNYLP